MNNNLETINGTTVSHAEENANIGDKKKKGSTTGMYERLSKNGYYGEEAEELFYQGIAQNLKIEIDKKGYSLKKVSDWSGISTAHLFRILKGDARIGMNALYNIACMLEKNPADFLPTTINSKQTNGQIYDEITKELDQTSNNVLLDSVATWVKEWRRLQMVFSQKAERKEL